MIKGIGVTSIHSPHGEKLADWYSKTLGIPIDATFPGWTEFKMSEGSRFAIDHTSSPRSVLEKQPMMISFEVDDIVNVVRELASCGVRFVPSVEQTIFDVGPSLVATFQDPDGNWVQLSQRKSP